MYNRHDAFLALSEKSPPESGFALLWLGHVRIRRVDCADGGALPRAKLMAAIRRIARVIDVPLSVDLEDGFIPGLAHAAALAPIARAVSMPLNLMMLPDMDSVNDLFATGARRFTLGPALFQSVYGYGRAQVRRFMQQQDASEMFGHDLPYPWLNAAFQA